MTQTTICVGGPGVFKTEFTRCYLLQLTLLHFTTGSRFHLVTDQLVICNCELDFSKVELLCSKPVSTGLFKKFQVPNIM